MDLLLAALGGGLISGISIKLFDYFFVLPAQERSAHRDWLKNKRLEAYSELTEQLISLGVEIVNDKKTGLELQRSASRTVLLIESPDFRGKVGQFFSNSSTINRKYNDLIDSGENFLHTEEGKELFRINHDLANELLNDLRSSLHGEI